MKRAGEKDSVPLTADDIVMDADESGMVITADEAVLFDRMDRKSGKAGAPKRAKREARKPIKSADQPSNMPFDDPQHREEREFKIMLNTIMPDIKKNKAFSGKSVVTNKLVYGVENVEALHRVVNILEDPLKQRNVLQFLTLPLQRRLLTLERYDQTEIKWRPVDLQWQTSKVRTVAFPAGSGLNLSRVAVYIDNNTNMDVWSIEMTVPSPAETLPDWVAAGMSHHGMELDAVGIIAIELVVDSQSVFRQRLIYVYGVTNKPIYNKSLVVSARDFDSILKRMLVPQGETRVHLERHNIFNTTEVHPIFEIPATYVGRYYFSPAPADKIEANSVANKLKDAKRLWDLRPVFDAHDQATSEKS